ncbi:MAG: nucleotidyl transferase AbiEii/AbiGii toxin family protein [Candidatus Vogelbacteria bacterium]|nr:nucleotidyl transferase AbiEii/AbiGii toxin family protein [Candidatus Vogelbacteria bacterium]
MIKLNWRLDVLPLKTKKALDYLGAESWLARAGWYLAGGTALALQTGHRQSVDLDFFTPEKTFAPASVVTHFPQDVWQAEIVKEGTIYGAVKGAKVSFIAYPFFVPVMPKLKYHGIEVLDKDDIAVMKIVAVSQRGRKRDFLDLFWYIKSVAPLASVINKLPRQYPTVAHDFHHIIKSLTYFADAEDDPMPEIFFKATWAEVKKFFQAEIKKIAIDLLGLN